LPNPLKLDLIKTNAEFSYTNVAPELISAFYETNLFKMRTKEGTNFGTLTDTDG